MRIATTSREESDEIVLIVLQNQIYNEAKVLIS